MGSEIEKLRALLEAATKGPWEVDGDANGDTWGRSGSIFVGHNESNDDAALIVAAVAALPALLDVCEAAAELMAVLWKYARPKGTVTLPSSLGVIGGELVAAIKRMGYALEKLHGEGFCDTEVDE